MNSKEYLEQIKYIDEVIDEKILEIDRLRTLATRVTSVNDPNKVQTSLSGDTLSSTVAKIVDLQNDLNDTIDKFIELKREAMEHIDQLKEPYYAKILYKRYFEYKTWETIADDLDITRQWVHKLHNAALNSFTF